jgi:hypothetical protein
MKENLERIRFVTANYNYLKGLLGIPPGIYFLLAAGGIAGWWQLFIPTQEGYVELVIFIALGGLYWGLVQYYNRTFGRVAHLSGNQKWVIIFGFIAIAAIVINNLFDLPVFLLGLAFAGMYLSFYISLKGRFHYLILSMALVVVSCLPLISDIEPADKIWGHMGAAFCLVLGGGMIIIALLDHWLLVRTLPSAPDEEPTATGEAWSHA